MLSINRTTTSRTTSGASWQSCIRERQSSKAITGLLTWTHSCARRNARSFMRLRCSITSATFDNLILRDGLKQEIQNDFAQFFQSRDVYERYRIPWKRGVLLIGPPGNGKTHTVKALVNQLARPCLLREGV